MRVIIDGIEYIPVTKHSDGMKLARMLLSEFWGSAKRIMKRHDLAAPDRDAVKQAFEHQFLA